MQARGFRKKVILFAILIFALAGIGGFFAFKNEVGRIASIPNLSPEELSQGLSTRKEDFVPFDVRTPAEFRESHLAGAIRIEPGMKAQGFAREHGDRLEGKTVVFYCTLGVRSTRLVHRIRDRLEGLGITAFYNLSGGIFRWSREGYPVVRTETPVDSPFTRRSPIVDEVAAQQRFAHVSPRDKTGFSITAPMGEGDAP